MRLPSSDAFVFFGATGDLAHKQIFPALQAMIRRGELAMPNHRCRAWLVARTSA